MSVLQVIGTGLQTGATVATESLTLTGYIVESVTDGKKTYDFEDVFTADGARTSRIIFNRNKNLILTMAICTATTPLTDFPEGKMATFTGLTDYFVTSAPITKVKGVHKITVTLDKILTQD